MRDIITKDFGWKLLSLVLAGIIWYTIWDTTVRGGRETSKGPFSLGNWQTRVYTNLPVRAVSAAADVREFKVYPESVEVTVSGRPEIIEALEEGEIRVAVDLTEIASASDLQKRVDVSTPPGVTVVRVDPPSVTIVVPPSNDSHQKP